MKSSYYTLLLVITLSFASTFSVSAQTSESMVSSEDKTETIKLRITGINCSGDLKDIQKQVSELKGVTSCLPAKKPAATTLFEVKFNPALVSEKEIRSAVEGTAGCSDPESRPYKVKS